MPKLSRCAIKWNVAYLNQDIQYSRFLRSVFFMFAARYFNMAKVFPVICFLQLSLPIRAVLRYYLYRA